MALIELWGQIRSYFTRGDSSKRDELDRMRRQTMFNNMRRGNEVELGRYLYYVVEDGTNIRRTNNSTPIIYSNADTADCNCNWAHEEVISVAAYNRVYGRFMIDDGAWYKTY